MRKKKILFAGILMIMCLATVGMGAYGIRQNRSQKDIASKILRFHVLANSDSESDQDLKLAVRDSVGTVMSAKLEGADNLSVCKNRVEENLAKIVHTAEQTIQDAGYDYPVEAYITEVDFPEKTYGEYTFPAGTYEALELIIGTGAGHNWWCVMYPNMCFEGSTYEVVDKKSKKALQAALSEDEYESLMEKKDYKISFKYLSFLNKYLK